ncbi:MAG TPA: hypothetical protein VGW38_10555, partial [Chloroflexota bacterium]|nr:hypothetical protein [Chloroflexota bacterium]
RKAFRQEIAAQQALAAEEGVTLLADPAAAPAHDELEAPPFDQHTGETLDAEVEEAAFAPAPVQPRQERKGPPLDREFSHAVEAGEIPDFGPDDIGEAAAEEEEPTSDMHQQYAELVRRARAAGLRNVPMMALDAPDDFVQAKYDEWLPKVEAAERGK